MNNHHYYQKNQDGLHSNPSSFDFYFHDHHFKFHTDDGVFSKAYIDYGSFALLKAFTLNAIEAPILDMGAGYGAIGITLSKLYQKEVVLSEINQRAYDLCCQNVKENQAELVTVYQGDLYEALPKDLLFSSIVTNPPIRAGKRIIYKIYEEAYNRLVEGGSLWVVIQKKQGAPSSKDFITSIFNNCEIINRDKGYYILRAIK